MKKVFDLFRLPLAICSMLVLGISCEEAAKVEPDPEITVSISVNTIELTKGQSVELSATVEPAEYASELEWFVSDESVATFKDGVLSGNNVGSTTLWAFVRKAQASCDVTVNPIEVTGIEMSDASVVLKMDETRQLSATIVPADAEGSISWYSSDESVATVNDNGLVTAVGFGKTTISARCGLISGQCGVSVEPEDPKIGDYFYSDGTWSDGGLVSMDEYGLNAVWADPKPAPLEGKTVIGIVFQTNPERMCTADKDAGYTHGYVVSTHIAHYSDDMETKYSLDQGIECLNNCRLGSSWYADINGSGETSQVYNTYAQIGKTGQVPAFKLVTEDFGSAPDNTSGWFIPSTGQLWDMVANFDGGEVAEMLKSYRNYGDDITYERGILTSYDAMERFNKMSALVPAEMKDDLFLPKTDQMHNYCGIWTSTLYDNSDGAACVFYLGNGKGNTFLCCDWVDNPYFIKPVLAF